MSDPGRVRGRLPWWVKVPAKVALSRLPVRYRLWASLGVFRHGKMKDIDYAIRVFHEHYHRSDFAKRGESFTALELGVGDSALSALIARAYGASHSYLVDVGRFVVTDVDFYNRAAKKLKALDPPCELMHDFETFDEMLKSCGGSYLTNGLESLRSIPDNTIDFGWSQAVLEHIRLRDFDAMQAELHRILAPGGVLSHRVDLKDHLGGALNNLRFSETTWESEFMARSGFYTNRIRYSDMLDRFKRAGFEAKIVKVDRWDQLPTHRRNLAESYRELQTDELRVSGFDVLLSSSK